MLALLIQAVVQALLAPPWFASADKNIAFSTPEGAFYCPLPDDWIGSDHGTVLYLQAPESCGGSGYASVSRGGTGLAIIIVEYGYRVEGVPRIARDCVESGRVELLGSMTPVCMISTQGGVSIRIAADYVAEGFDKGIPATITFTLITTSERGSQDQDALIRMVETTRLCSRESGSKWPACPRGAQFF